MGTLLIISHSHLLSCCRSSEFVWVFTPLNSQGSELSPAPVWRRWSRWSQSFGFHFLVDEFRQVVWHNPGQWGGTRRSFTGGSWAGFPHFYKQVFKNETFPILHLEIVSKTVMLRFAAAIWQPGVESMESHRRTDSGPYIVGHLN